MKEDVIKEMVLAGAISRVQISYWLNDEDETNPKDVWHVYFVNKHNDVIHHSLDLARGGIREFKSLDAAFSVISKIVKNHVSDIRIIPSVWL